MMSMQKTLFLGGLAAATVVVSTGLSALSTPAAACDSDPYLGAICFTAATYCPQNYAMAAGQTLTISSNEALFSVLGTTYGGDGTTNFALPDLRGRAAISAGTGTGLSPAVRGQTLGAEQVTLTPATMPAHTHTATFTGQTSAVTIQPKLQVVSTSPTQATSPVASAATPYLAGAAGSGLSAKKIWTASAGTSPVNVGGLGIALSPLPAASGGPAVTNELTGNPTPTPVATLPPQLGLTPCIAVNGTYPMSN